MKQHNNLPQIAGQKEVLYPDQWPDVPQEFELKETTNFVGGGEEFIFSSELFDLRISTHEDVYSGTIRVCSNHIDYRLESENEVIDWLSCLFKLYNSCIAVQPHPSRESSVLRGVKEDCTILSYKKDSGIVEWEDKMEDLTLYKKWNIHQPSNIDTLRVVLRFTGAVGSCIYVFDNHIINIYKTDSKKTNESFVIPDYQLVFKDMSKYDPDEFELLYIDETVRNEKILKEFI